MIKDSPKNNCSDGKKETLLTNNQFYELEDPLREDDSLEKFTGDLGDEISSLDDDEKIVFSQEYESKLVSKFNQDVSDCIECSGHHDYSLIDKTEFYLEKYRLDSWTLEEKAMANSTPITLKNIVTDQIFERYATISYRIVDMVIEIRDRVHSGSRPIPIKRYIKYDPTTKFLFHSTKFGDFLFYLKNYNLFQGCSSCDGATNSTVELYMVSKSILEKFCEREFHSTSLYGQMIDLIKF